MGLGCAAGFAATFLMDEVTELLYTEDIARREREVQAESANAVMARKILTALGLNPNENDIKRVAPLFHWALGASCGALAGLLADGNAARSSLAVASGMFVFDEVILSLLGAAPPSTRYPWQTNLRSLKGHATYALSLALTYEALAALAKSDCD